MTLVLFSFLLANDAFLLLPFLLLFSGRTKKKNKRNLESNLSNDDCWKGTRRNERMKQRQRERKMINRGTIHSSRCFLVTLDVAKAKEKSEREERRG